MMRKKQDHADDLEKQAREIQDLAKGHEREAAKLEKTISSYTKKLEALEWEKRSFTAPRVFFSLSDRDNVRLGKNVTRQLEIREVLQELKTDLKSHLKLAKQRRSAANALNRKALQWRKSQIRKAEIAQKQSATFGKGHPPRKLIYNWNDAEDLACAYLKWLGFSGIVRTREGADGGIDVASKSCYGQVKAHMKQTPLAEVQRHFGVSVADGRFPVFFAMSYSKSAADWALARPIALFAFDREGRVVPSNPQAVTLHAVGWPSFQRQKNGVRAKPLPSNKAKSLTPKKRK